MVFFDAILKRVRSTDFTKEEALALLPEIDSVPTQDSENPISSGAVYTALGDVESALDAIIGGA